MGKPVKSTDARKKAIVAAIKAKAGCTKVTCVEEVSPGVFKGNPMWPVSAESDLSKDTVTAEEAGLATEGAASEVSHG